MTTIFTSCFPDEFSAQLASFARAVGANPGTDYQIGPLVPLPADHPEREYGQLFSVDIIPLCHELTNQMLDLYHGCH